MTMVLKIESKGKERSPSVSLTCAVLLTGGMVCEPE